MVELGFKTKYVDSRALGLSVAQHLFSAVINYTLYFLWYLISLKLFLPLGLHTNQLYYIFCDYKLGSIFEFFIISIFFLRKKSTVFCNVCWAHFLSRTCYAEECRVFKEVHHESFWMILLYMLMFLNENGVEGVAERYKLIRSIFLTLVFDTLPNFFLRIWYFYLQFKSDTNIFTGKSKCLKATSIFVGTFLLRCEWANITWGFLPPPLIG